jgi:hypothetical protein
MDHQLREDMGIGVTDEERIAVCMETVRIDAKCLVDPPPEGIIGGKLAGELFVVFNKKRDRNIAIGDGDPTVPGREHGIGRGEKITDPFKGSDFTHGSLHVSILPRYGLKRC